MMSKIKRNISTPESRQFWESTEKASAVAQNWPSSRRAGINVSDRRAPTERELRDERDRVEGRERKKRAGRFRNPTNGIGWCRDREPRQYDILGNAEPEVQFYFEGHGGCTFSTDVAELVHDDMTTSEVCQVLLAETSIWCRSGAVIEKVLRALKETD